MWFRIMVRIMVTNICRGMESEMLHIITGFPHFRSDGTHYGNCMCLERCCYREDMGCVCHYCAGIGHEGCHNVRHYERIRNKTKAKGTGSIGMDKGTDHEGTDHEGTRPKGTGQEGTGPKGTDRKGTGQKGTPAKGTPAKGTTQKGTPAKRYYSFRDS